MTTAQWVMWVAMTATSWGFLFWFVKKTIEGEDNE